MGVLCATAAMQVQVHFRWKPFCEKIMGFSRILPLGTHRDRARGYGRLRQLTAFGE
jgi:hypothetical protein